MLPSPFIAYALAIEARASSLGYLVHRRERSRSLALLLTNGTDSIACHCLPLPAIACHCLEIHVDRLKGELSALSFCR
jgi:hypothetical protein